MRKKDGVVDVMTRNEVDWYQLYQLSVLIKLLHIFCNRLRELLRVENKHLIATGRESALNCYG